MARMRCPAGVPGVPAGLRGTSEAGRLTTTESRIAAAK
jgi:hypothetical protein